MRKTNPTGIVEDFESEIGLFRAYYLRLMGNEATLKGKSFIAELILQRGFVAVEGFLSAWLTGAINRDSTAYLAQREVALRQSLKAKDKFKWDETHLAYTAPKHISMDDLQALLDPEGKNMIFASLSDFKCRCNQWLTGSSKQKAASISQDQCSLIDAAKAIRNCLSHQSKSSFDTMNKHLAQLGSVPSLQHLGRAVSSVSSVGAYLKAESSGRTRVEHYLDGFLALASSLK